MSINVEEIKKLTQTVSEVGDDLNNLPGPRSGHAEISFPELYEKHFVPKDHDPEASFSSPITYTPPYRIGAGVNIGTMAEFSHTGDDGIVVSGAVKLLGESCESEPDLKMRLPHVENLGRKIGDLSIRVGYPDRVYPPYAGASLDLYDSGNVVVGESTELVFGPRDHRIVGGLPMNTYFTAALDELGLAPVFKKLLSPDGRYRYTKVLEEIDARIVLDQFRKLVAKR